MSTQPEATQRAYKVGQRLRHHSGGLWEVVETDLPGDGKTWGEGMVLCQGDYRLRCVTASANGNAPGRRMRVHADYLHGNGWQAA